MGWIYLFIASIFEMGWPFGIKMIHNYPDFRIFWIVFAIITMALSGYFLFLSQKQISIGTAYAVWTGIGTLGTFLIGITIFHDSASVARFVGVFLILAGVIVLKLCN